MLSIHHNWPFLTAVINPCGRHNGGCQQICLLSHRTDNDGLGYRCKCRLGYDLQDDRHTCFSEWQTEPARQIMNLIVCFVCLQALFSVRLHQILWNKHVCLFQRLKIIYWWLLHKRSGGFLLTCLLRRMSPCRSLAWPEPSLVLEWSMMAQWRQCSTMTECGSSFTNHPSMAPVSHRKTHSFSVVVF